LSDLKDNQTNQTNNEDGTNNGSNDNSNKSTNGKITDHGRRIGTSFTSVSTIRGASTAVSPLGAAFTTSVVTFATTLVSSVGGSTWASFTASSTVGSSSTAISILGQTLARRAASGSSGRRRRWGRRRRISGTRTTLASSSTVGSSSTAISILGQTLAGRTAGRSSRRRVGSSGWRRSGAAGASLLPLDEASNFHSIASELALGISVQGAFGDGRHDGGLGVSIGSPANSIGSVVIGRFFSRAVQLWGDDINVTVSNDGAHEGTSISNSIRSGVGDGNTNLQTLGAGSSERGSKGGGQTSVSLFDVVDDTTIMGVLNLATVDGCGDTLDGRDGPTSRSISSTEGQVFGSRHLVNNSSRIADGLSGVCPAAEGDGKGGATRGRGSSRPSPPPETSCVSE